jgi:hypothetical protein
VSDALLFRGRCLTLWPEWAWAILALGKRVENRGWALPVGEWFGLHAGARIGGTGSQGAIRNGIDAVITASTRAGWRWRSAMNTPMEIDAKKMAVIGATHGQIVRKVPTSQIVGLFRVDLVHLPGQGPADGWRVPDQFGNVFRFRPLASPITCGGAQGLWRADEKVADELRRALRDGGGR